MAELPADDRKMSDAEGLMWRLEKDPYLSSTFGTVSILDRPPDVDRLRERMERAVAGVPRLGWRVQPAPADLAAPRWADDLEFDIDYHVRRLALPRPGTLRQLLELASVLILDPFDRTRPLWQFFVVEGLRGGKAALVQKMHHTITDGVGGVQLAMQYLDLERDARDLPPLRPVDAEPPPVPSPLELATDTVRTLIAAGIRLPLGVARQVGSLLADPASIPGANRAAVETVRGIVTQLTDTERAHSPLWRERSLHRHLAVARAPFRETLDAARRLGGTLNIAFLTAAAEAAGRYHRELGAPVESLRASMAISTRTDTAAANAFSLARLDVPTGEMPIAERFRLVTEAADRARERSDGASLAALAGLAAVLPTSLVTRLARQQSQTIDFATSNVKGSPVPVFIAGAQLLENYPAGPLVGVAFNLTLLSYHGSLDMGINVDPAAVAEPERLGRLLNRAFRQLARS